MLVRPRRLRKSENIRKMVRETQLSTSSLVYPIFITEGENIKKEISSMPGQYHYSIDKVLDEIEELLNLNITKILIFGITNKKDEYATEAYNTDGLIQRAIRKIKNKYQNICIIADVCMCEYTCHGHCGIIYNNEVDNDKSLEYLAKIALSYAKAGADIIAPSDMMDGRVKAIRETLDENGFYDLAIMSYSAKYASAFYGPFREAANSAPAFGDRKSYQMDFYNKKEAVKETLLDIDEGADIVMVKPAMTYLDIVSSLKDIINIPIAAYSVSGEYAMVKAGSRLGFIDEKKIIEEMAVSAFRAGASIYITYFAKEIADMINCGLI